MPAVLSAAAVLDQHPEQMGLDIQANHGGEGNMERVQEHFQPESQFKKSLTMRRFTSSKPTEESADVTIPANE